MKFLFIVLSLNLLISCGKSKSNSNPVATNNDFLITEENSTELAFLMSTTRADINASGATLVGLWRPEVGKREESFIILNDAVVVITECSGEDGKKFYTALKLKATKTNDTISVPAQDAKTESIELEDGSILTCGENVEAMTIEYRLSQGKLYIEGEQGEYSNIKILDLDEISHLL
jgi:hypothetical protein